MALLSAWAGQWGKMCRCQVFQGLFQTKSQTVNIQMSESRPGPESPGQIAQTQAFGLGGAKHLGAWDAVDITDPERNGLIE